MEIRKSQFSAERGLHFEPVTAQVGKKLYELKVVSMVDAAKIFIHHDEIIAELVFKQGEKGCKQEKKIDPVVENKRLDINYIISQIHNTIPGPIAVILKY